MLALMFRKRAARLERISEEVRKARAEAGQGERQSSFGGEEQPRRVTNADFVARIAHFRKKGSGVRVMTAAEFDRANGH
jgi:hypothetical protein